MFDGDVGIDGKTDIKQSIEKPEHNAERETEYLIQTCVTHHQRVLELNILYGNDLSEEMKEMWKHISK